LDSAGYNGQPDSSDNLLLPEQEAWIARLAIRSITVLVGLHLVVIVFLLGSQASKPWHYASDIAALAMLLACGLALAAYNRYRHLQLVRRLQARLLTRAVELQEVATRDDLTQLHNRRYFYDRLQMNLERARSARQPLALLLVDVDGLKTINDNHGHLVGDAVLRNLAQIMSRHVRAGDVVARLGGDEFAIIMPDADKRGAHGLSSRLWQELSVSPIYQEKDVSFHLSISIGVSGYPWGGDTVSQLLHWADTDMYTNKISRKLPVSSTAERGTFPDIEQAPDDYGLRFGSEAG